LAKKLNVLTTSRFRPGIAAFSFCFWFRAANTNAFGTLFSTRQVAFNANTHKVLGVSQGDGFLGTPSKKISFIDLAFFHNSIYNQIAIVAVSPIDLTYTYQNIDNFYSKGASLNVSSKIKDFRYTLGASYIGVYNNAFDVLNNNKFLYSPELRAQLTYSLKIKKHEPVSLSLFYKYNGVMNGFAFNETRDIVPTKIAAFNILDVTANKTFWDKKLSLTIGLKNLLNITNVLATGNTSVHSGGSNSMPISVGRSLFAQLLLKI
jgi:outer membrane receptor for ferrienterochelin and colicins